MRLPRVMITAPKSGSGKTIITCGLLSFLKERGINVASYKCGPDYIDPMFHRSVIGVPGRNLDTFFSSEDEIRSILSSADCDAAVMEGVMGIYDGIAGAGGKGSCYDVAVVTDTPVILITDVKGMGPTMLSVIKGILLDDTHNMIRGIVLNRISQRYYTEISPYIDEMLKEISSARGVSVRLLGGIPHSPDIRLESRHLGLMMPGEIDDLRDQVSAAAHLIEEHLDPELLLEIMQSAGELPDKTTAEAVCDDNGPVLAVARDEAFCFYYEENLKTLSAYGIRIKEFSPLHDKYIPEDADGLLLGGGYPELYADVLSGNTSMMDSIREAISSGMPSLAECGGFMTLMKELEDKNGNSYKMAGAISGKTWYTGKLGRFGYVTVIGSDAADVSQTLIGGLSIRGHEFHYFDSTDNGTDAEAVKPGRGTSWKCIHAGVDHVWGYPHLYYPSCPEMISRFRKAMDRYREEKHG